MTEDSSGRVGANGTRTGFLERLTRGLRRKSADPIEVDPVELLREKAENGETIAFSQRDMIMKAASFDRIKVGDVMVPRADIDGVEVNMTLAEVATMFAREQHSRLPIYRDVLDNPVGFVHVKDVLPLLTPREDGTTEADPYEKILPRLRRDLLFVPPSMLLPNLLVQMRANRCHMALVVDEYGGTDGLVTVEDLVEQVIGEIDDEHDDAASDQIVQEVAGRWKADARIELDELQAKVGADFGLEDMEDEIDTLGGVVFALAGRVPPRGELLRHPNGFEFEVLDADPRKIKMVRVRAPRAIGTAAIDPRPA